MRRSTLCTALIVVVAAIAATALTLRGLNENPPPPFPSLRFTLSVPPNADLGSGDDVLDAAISPDEQRVVFVATATGGPSLWLRALDQEDAQPIAGTGGASLPAWKRGGGAVSFFAGGMLRQVALADGSLRDLAAASSPGGAAWLNDGSVIVGVSATGPLRRLRNGVLSDATTLQPGDRAHVFPSSADGDAWIYVAVRDDGTRVVRLDSPGAPQPAAKTADLATTSAQAQLVGGQLVHVRDGVLVAIRVDPDTNTTTGRTAALATSIAVGESGHASFAASPRLLLTAPAAPRARQLAWINDAGQRLGTVGEPGDYWQARLSPDDRHVAVTMVDPLLKTLDVMTMPTDRPGDREKLTLALAADTDPVWSPDGTRVIFRSLEDGRPALFSRRVHDPQAPIENGRPGDDTPTDWRGTAVMVTAPGARSLDVQSVDRTTGARSPIAATGFNERDGRWSPDGRWVAFVSDESGQPDVYAKRGETRRRVSFAGGSKPRWSGDGRTLYFLRGNEILRADLSGERFTPPRTVTTIQRVRDFDTARRSRRLLVLLSGIVPSPPATVVVNWRSPLPAAQEQPDRR